MALSAIDVISPAFDRMKKMLLPFRFGQWLRLAIVGFLAGEMGGSGGGNGVQYLFNIPPDIFRPRGQNFQAPLAAAGGILLVIGIALLILLVLVLGLVFAYISSRMRFVLFDAIVNGECRIRESWGRRGGPALRYFIWQILYGLAGWSIWRSVGIPAFLAYGMGWFQTSRSHSGLRPRWRHCCAALSRVDDCLRFGNVSPASSFLKWRSTASRQRRRGAIVA
jgi:hypothetical protein